ncbi:DNA polymerase/3'-5' exonuclease PolX [Algoriphagus sediminis]|uniref:DNA polymerase/3'-5' exonuclease PolX n=1 Tax=Algoriphagus sediminis TaxID=3057113 RepID=A0ABT7YGL9_9BACT|nr:DNA polymerase/3'-5' exonuclease PolX [Algoriphagus sediminis]MDN3205674.1 DNA polymerase/3'-5' exonuclease PolX [Algoriphagus sediminis]
MDQKSILKKLKLTVQLMELHEENPFKIRSFQGALNSLDRLDQDFTLLSSDELAKIPGVGKSILGVIEDLKESESHPLLDNLLEKTPSGLLEILQIKGLGPKKVKTLWTELGITSTHELMEACQSGKVAQIKGFGEKTQNTIIQNLEFKASNENKALYADIEEIALDLKESIKKAISQSDQVILVGDFARNLEIISSLEYLVGSDDWEKASDDILKIKGIDWSETKSGPFTLKGTLEGQSLEISVYWTDKVNFVQKQLLLSASPQHLQLEVQENKSMGKAIVESQAKSEEEFFAGLDLQFIPPELREGADEIVLAKEGKLPKLLEEGDLKGILHNHSTYSDGKHSLRQMAEHCKKLGYEYLGISDHSRSAFYAGGLEAERIVKQHEEIDALNQELAPFKIFKGIESDILADGQLDYPDEVLASFDFIVSSVHSILNMDINRATQRLIKAIENPYTTILGHPTGRLLLRRKGYPIDHKAVIDACAENDVVIEINANPWRLDLDWRWIRYALEKGVKLSINPDAHEMDGYLDMKYGVLIGRKGGLTADMTLNTMSVDEIDEYFKKRKAKYLVK